MTIRRMVTKQRIYAFLLILGASILLFRTLRLLFFEQGLEILVLWVIILTVLESIIDSCCIIGSLRWLISNDALKATFPLRLGAAAAILHALRVLIYVLGRTGPWVNFDVKPIYRSSYSFDWFWVWFAAILSVLGVIGVIVIWKLRRRSKI
jgi:predicted lysophospholipase L1 biosynthesis ABC-type transport system permease subunit